MLASAVAAVLLLVGMVFLTPPFLRTNLPDGHTTAAVLPGDEKRPLVITGPPLLRTTLDHQGKVQGLAFTPDGKWLISAARNSVAGNDLKIFDAASGTLIYQEGNGGIQALALTPDGKTLITGGYHTDADRNILRILDLSSRKLAGTIPIDTAGIAGLAVAPDGRTLACAETQLNQTLVKLHDLAAARQPVSAPVGHYGSHGLKFSPDGRFLAVCLHSVYLAILATDPLGEVLHRDVGFSRWVDISRDSRLILVGGSVAGKPAFHLISLPDGAPVHVEENLPAVAAAGACSPADDLLAVALEDGSVRLIDSRTFRSLADWTAHAPFPAGGHNYRGAVAFSPDGRMLATASGEGLIKLWDLTRPASRAVPTAEAPFSSHRSTP
jgi:WD40 repeat protein